MKNAYDWYRLDNSAIMYQMVLTPAAQSLFRLGVKLNSAVNPDYLKKAIEKAFSRHKQFRCELKHGFFRPYLDENKLPFIVEEDDGVLLKMLDFSHNNRYLLRVSYFKNRIFIDFFHGLCDGSGALEFLKTVIFYYFEEQGIPFPSDNIMTENTPFCKEETEDAFSKYYIKPELSKGINSMAGGQAFGMRGKTFSSTGYGLIQATVDTDALLAASRARHCSITVLLTALMFSSVYRAYINGNPKHNLTAFVPINLRKRYPSKTLGNFTVFAKIILPLDSPKDFESLVPIVKDLMEKQLSKEELDLKTGFTSLMSKMPLFKFMPLFIKGYISRTGRKFSKPKQTFILSNLGKVELGENPYINEFSFNLNCNKKTPDNIGVVSYGNKTVISFTRKLVSTEVERIFCSDLSALCGGATVISNFREECDAL